MTPQEKLRALTYSAILQHSHDEALADKIADSILDAVRALGFRPQDDEPVVPDLPGAAKPAITSPNVPMFAGAPDLGLPAPAVAPHGLPGEAAQHYNHVRTEGGSSFRSLGANDVPPATPPAAASPVPAQAAPASPVTPWYPPHLRHIFAPNAPAPAAAPPAPMPVASPAPGAPQVIPAIPAGGIAVIPPTGGGYAPPAQAGVQNQVTMTRTPEGHSALGGGGVVSQPVQTPNGPQQVVNPSGQLVVTQPGGGGVQYVAEQIVR